MMNGALAAEQIVILQKRQLLEMPEVSLQNQKNDRVIPSIKYADRGMRSGCCGCDGGILNNV